MNASNNISGEQIFIPQGALLYVTSFPSSKKHNYVVDYDNYVGIEIPTSYYRKVSMREVGEIG